MSVGDNWNVTGPDQTASGTRIAQSAGPLFPFAMVTTVVTGSSGRCAFVRTS